jgi:hypothetical protein
LDNQHPTAADSLDRSDAADAIRFRWILRGNGYFLPEPDPYERGPIGVDETRRVIDGIIAKSSINLGVNASEEPLNDLEEEQETNLGVNASEEPLNTPEPFTRVPSKEQSCRNCYYARPSDRGRAWKVSCRVHPPHQAWNFATETFEPLWPQVEVGEWCGHWHEVDQ